NLFRCKMTFDTVDNADFLFEMIVRIHITNLYKFILLTLVTTPFIFDDHWYFLGVGILHERSAAASPSFTPLSVQSVAAFFEPNSFSIWHFTHFLKISV